MQSLKEDYQKVHCLLLQSTCDCDSLSKKDYKILKEAFVRVRAFSLARVRVSGGTCARVRVVSTSGVCVWIILSDCSTRGWPNTFPACGPSWSTSAPGPQRWLSLLPGRCSQRPGHSDYLTLPRGEGGPPRGLDWATSGGRGVGAT